MTDDRASEQAVREPEGRRTRRGLLVSALGGLGAWAAASIARPAPVQGGTDGDVVLGAENISSEPTTIRARESISSAQVTILEPLQAEEHIAVHADVSSEQYGVAVRATGAITGHGVEASSHFGTALYGASEHGRALETVGRVTLRNHSGIALIPAGRTSVTVQVGVHRDSVVTMSPMVNLGGRSLWYTKDSRGNTLTFHISSARTSTTRLAWHMLD